MARKRRLSSKPRRSGAPFLRHIATLPEKATPGEYPFNIPAFTRGIDEPEAALSSQRQLSFLRIIHDLSTPGHAQFLIATHSPILLSYPEAILFSLDGSRITEVSYRDTDHFLITRDFLNCPERFFKHLFVPPANPDPNEER